MGELDGKQAIVTGGAQGIGLAVARRLADEGAAVAVLDRDVAGAEQAGSLVGGVGIGVDVRDGEAVETAVHAALEALGGCSILVNNAGVGDLRPLHAVDDRMWDRIVDVNLRGPFNCTRAVVPVMSASGGGAIVNNASLSGRMPTRGEAAYSAAKAGVIALTASTALEYGPDIRCNCVAPGFIRTPMTQVWDEHPEAFAPLAEAIPLGRIGDPEEVAELVLFLASDRASYLTGQTVTIDGGLSLAQVGTDAALGRLMKALSADD